MKTFQTAFLLAAVAAPVLAQTSTPAKPTGTAAKPVVHHRVAPRACAADVAPVLPAAIPPVKGVYKTEYALHYIDITPGTGELAPAHGFYTVHYTGWLASDGKKFDSSLDRKEPITFPVNSHRVIPGWDTGFEGMHIGGKRRLFIPYQLAYGETGRPPVIPPKSDLIFDVELISVSDKPPAPPQRPEPPKPPVPPAAAPAKPAAPPAGTGTTPPAGTGTTPPAGTTQPAPAAPANKAAEPAAAPAAK